MQRLWPLFALAAIAATLIPQTSAGDFAIIADLENGTIYAGSMASRLADLTPLPLVGVTRPVAVDYDPVDKMVYWSDLGNAQVAAKISRAHLNGSNQVVLVDGTTLPDGLALDLVARVLYWTDGTLQHISRKPMDESGNEESIIEGLDKPRSIIIDHERSTLYWTDWGDNPRIERADLNGGNRRTIIEGGLTWPNGVSIDFEDDTLYWCDASTDRIEKSDLSGADRQLVVNIAELVPLSHPFDLSLYKNYVYWTDWMFKAVLRIHKDGRGDQVFGPLAFQRAGGIHIQEESNYCDSFPCQQEGVCQDIVNGFICYCPSGFRGLTCSLKVVGPCDAVPCLNGGNCMAIDAETFDCACRLGYQGTVCEIVAGCVISSDDRTAGLLITPDKAVYLPGENAQFDCSDGYELSESAVRFCQLDFTWSGERVECIYEDPCDSTPCANDGSCSFSGQQYTCSCWPGYTGATCLQVAGCVISSDDRTAGLLVTPDKAVYLAGENVQFDCSDGYELSGSAVRFCQSDFTWSGERVECIYEGSDIHCISPDVANLKEPADKDFFEAGDMVTFSCEPGYNIRDSTTRLCLENGTWSGAPLECESEDSGRPGAAVIVGASLGGIFIVLLTVGVLVYFVRCRIRFVENSGRTVNVSAISNETPSRVPHKDSLAHIYQGHISVAPSYDEDYAGYMTASHDPLPDSPTLKLQLLKGDSRAIYMEMA